MASKLVTTARSHNAFCNALFSSMIRVAAVLRAQLLPWMSSLLTDALREPVDGSLVNEHLRASRSDKLFRVQFKSGRPGFAHVLLEHKSNSAPGTALQVWKYKTRIWERHAQGKASRLRALPPIFPLVVYHGPREWSAPPSIAAMLGTDDPQVRALEPDFGYVLRDLSRLPVGKLAEDPAARAGLAAPAGSHAGEEARRAALPVVLGGLSERSDFAKRVVAYITGAWKVSVPDLRSAAGQSGKGEQIVGEIVQELLDLGKAEGIVLGEATGTIKGEPEGEAKASLMLLEHRFGPLPEAVVRRVRGAPLAELDAWFAVVLAASSLAEVFGDLAND